MKNIILATHGNLSFEFKNTLELIVGKTDNIECFGMTKDKSSESGKKELGYLIESVDESNLIILTDLFGGSSANICMELLLQGHKFKLLTGLNLPMLLSLVTSDNDDISVNDLTNKIIDSAKSGVVDVNKAISERS
ncbi:PTS sugar transporter subunit IIA [Companilactobacillus kimchii]|uniref:Pts system fructose subfamily iia component n=2 Tax=Companilactobacillus kimchii TaxID=2801452 RepID=A0ABR5NR87_9LACO|nr:PTS mannose transporter subunit IIA [Companilactobacillus kimchii]KAE9557450.1 PTS mannose transporter subunit IIA [Companilactobacillus kimchii]KRK50183.1 pts system fructose subfamily iia component [Companilactobacillus kimchii DSM 13961 = JCM 10707]OWF32172.1 Protein-N(pi)-phosphohistidine--sugar phosphotransferase [Companilactobacillus kimchii]GEO48340.1 PTS mannose transporter subunit IIA [Companilactobacillus paralimentarius]